MIEVIPKSPRFFQRGEGSGVPARGGLKSGTIVIILPRNLPHEFSL
jgi:hypothetical protein